MALRVGARMQGLAVSRDGGTLYGTDIQRSKLISWDLPSGSSSYVETNVGTPTGTNAFDVKVTPDNAQLSRPVRKTSFRPLRSGNQTAGQCNERETTNDQSDSLVRPAEIVTDVWPDQRQNRADAKKTKESRPDQRPEAGTQATARPHCIDCTRDYSLCVG